MPSPSPSPSSFNNGSSCPPVSHAPPSSYPVKLNPQSVASSNLSTDMALDTDLYSRQIGAYGMEMMGRLIKMNVLISGLKGVGVETAKNLILAGPSSVYLHDDSLVSLSDLGSNFYLKPSDVGERTRAEASIAALGGLNSYVTTSLVKGDLLEEIKKMKDPLDVVVVSGIGKSSAIAINNYCRLHNPPIGFIFVDCFGLCGFLFVDFGDEFVVFDHDGNEPKSAIIEGITKDNPGTVHLHPDKPCPFQNGDFVTFKEVQGMVELNVSEGKVDEEMKDVGARRNTSNEIKTDDVIPPNAPREVTLTGRHSFTIGDTSKLSPFKREGIVVQVKMPRVMTFKSLEECIPRPLPAGETNLIVADLGKFGRSEQLHLGVQSVLEYMDIHSHPPPPRNPSAVKECLQLASNLNALCANLPPSPTSSWRPSPVETLDIPVVSRVVEFAACHISPLAAFMGGIAAQEVVKHTGKYSPLRQWFYFDCFEVLQDEKEGEKPKNEYSSVPSRYDDQIVIFGRSFQRSLEKLRLFLVGAGALGCEMIKALALMGCCCGDGGNLLVTDMDMIEVSNLNRQFLFHRQHIGASKSLTAAKAALDINPTIQITSSTTRVGPETEEEFNDALWEGLDIIINALDNVTSRMYVDTRCVWYHKPLLESGTLGTKANVQVVVPHLTQSYGDSQDPPEESIPLCTLKHFPNQIEHTIEWARDAFQGLFADGPQEALTFLRGPEAYLSKLNGEGTTASQRGRLSNIHRILSSVKDSPTYSKCVESAVKLFTEYFEHQIAQLIHTFPVDHQTSSGMLFWSGPKRAPTPIRFDCNDELHLSFVMSAANLFAYNIGLTQEKDVAVVRDMAAKIELEAFKPKQVRIKVDEKDSTVEGSGDDDYMKEKLVKELSEICASLRQSPKTSSSSSSSASNNLISTTPIDKELVVPIEFEKDDDSNFHVDFISSCANLRARNYKIPECDKHKSKMIAGKIIPALASTTAMTTGLVSIELLKLVTCRSRRIEDFKNSFINLSLPLWLLSEPLPPLKTVSCEFDPIAGGPIRARPEGFSSWDRIEIKIANPTIGDVIDFIENSQKVDVAILSIGNICIYNGFVKDCQNKRSNKIKDQYELSTKKALPPFRNYLPVEASVADKEDGVDVMIPTIKLIFK